MLWVLYTSLDFPLRDLILRLRFCHHPTHLVASKSRGQKRRDARQIRLRQEEGDEMFGCLEVALEQLWFKAKLGRADLGKEKPKDSGDELAEYLFDQRNKKPPVHHKQKGICSSNMFKKSSELDLVPVMVIPVAFLMGCGIPHHYLSIRSIMTNHGRLNLPCPTLNRTQLMICIFSGMANSTDCFWYLFTRLPC